MRHWNFQTTFSDVMERNRGVGPGFDLMRFGLAVTVLVVHVNILARPGGFLPPDTGAPPGTLPSASFWNGYTRPLALAIVPMFFALSGFLVMGSAERLRSTTKFLTFRALRIVPALFVETVLSAIVLGAIFTSLPLGRYFTDPGFWRYFGNIVGWVEMELPGVFEHNPIPHIVNGALRTLPAELDCYLVIAVLMACAVLFLRPWLTAVFAIVTIIFAALNAVSDFGETARFYELHTFTYYFFAGVLFYVWRERIPYSLPIFIGSAACAYLLLYLRHTAYIAPPFVTYCTIALGLTPLPTPSFVRKGDYSYGIYLYHSPIAQALIAIFPFLVGHVALAIPATLIGTFAFAAASWHFIEKPALRLKRFLVSEKSKKAKEILVLSAWEECTEMLPYRNDLGRWQLAIKSERRRILADGRRKWEKRPRLATAENWKQNQV